MPPIIKNSDARTATPDTTSQPGSAAASPAESAPRQQAVALEIPITVNGARTAEGSNKREPFSETSKTVLIYGAGAVIRLTSSVAPGQLLFLTNERTKKEVVCQVVKSKNYRNISGYVELEFTEPAVGFWGMRFPGDRIGSAPQPAAAGAPGSSGAQIPARPGAAKIEQPFGKGVPSNGAAKAKPPVAAAPSASSSIVPPPIDSEALLGISKPKPNEIPVPATVPKAIVPSNSTVPGAPAEATQPQSIKPSFPTFDEPRTADKPASIFAPAPQASAAQPTVDLSSLVPFFEVKPSASPVEPQPAQVQVPVDPDTETLKHHTERLQEELSRMNFAESASEIPVSPPEAPSFPVVEKDEIHDKAVRLVEPSSAPAPGPILEDLPEPIESAKAAPVIPVAPLDSLEQEELKIPSWLEPLARNTAAPSSTKELVLREKAKRLAEQPEVQELSVEPRVPVKEEKVSQLRMPEFGSALPMDGEREFTQSSSQRPERGVLLGALAAGILLAGAAGWWWMNQRSTGFRASASAAQAAIESVLPAPMQTKPQADAALQTNLPAEVEPAASPVSSVKSVQGAQTHTAPNLSSSAANSSITPTRNTHAPASSVEGAPIVDKPSSTEATATPLQPQKPTLGEVHLAAPKISRTRHAQNGAEAEAELSMDEVQPDTDVDALNSGLATGSKQPVAPMAPAPVAVGGDVKQARLISSVPPVYPAMAKAQHISGNVTVDALIDVNGRVTTMKVISGPTLLHQAAMDALKLWKYQPATLDGKAVPMHLSVTIQFRLQ